MKINQDLEALIMKTISWHFGADVVIKKVRGKTIVTSYPDMSKRKLSPKQKQMNEMMLDAVRRPKIFSGMKN